MGAEGPPIVIEPAVGVAHRMGVLAQDQRPAPIWTALLFATLCPRGDLLDRAVHRRYQVAHRVLGVEVEHDRALVAERPAGVEEPQRTGQAVMGRALPRLVAQRPDDHGRVIAVALRHAQPPLDDRAGEQRPGGQRHLTPVALHVGLVNHVQAQLVAHVIEPRSGWGVGGADGVDVEPLGQTQLKPGGLGVDVATPGGAVLVAVDASD